MYSCDPNKKYEEGNKGTRVERWSNVYKWGRNPTIYRYGKGLKERWMLTYHSCCCIFIQSMFAWMNQRYSFSLRFCELLSQLIDKTHCCEPFINFNVIYYVCLSSCHHFIDITLILSLMKFEYYTVSWKLVTCLHLILSPSMNIY